MAEHGGPRTPQNPAPVSGPGKLSRRTDGKPGQKVMVTSGGAYGDRKAMVAQQEAAPLAQSPSVAPAPLQGGPDQPQMPTYGGGPFGGPSTQPNVPVTNGVPIGPGAGPEALAGGPQPVGGAPATGAMTRLLSQFAPTDASGVVASLLARAQTLGV